MRTFERLFLITGTALGAASLAAGCGGGDDSGSGDVTTGLAQSTPLSDVSAADAEKACNRLQAGFDARFSGDKLTRTICTIVGAAAADTPSECESLRDSCIDAANEQGSETMMDIGVGELDLECDSSSSNLNQCTGTVGQLEACFNDTLDQFDALLGDISCADAASVGMEDIDSLGGDAGPPASCEAVDCGDGSPFGG
jgi:hypothetical protein